MKERLSLKESLGSQEGAERVDSIVACNGLLATDNDEIFPVKAKRCCGEARRCDISSANDMQNHRIIS